MGDPYDNPEEWEKITLKPGEKLVSPPNTKSGHDERAKKIVDAYAKDMLVRGLLPGNGITGIIAQALRDTELATMRRCAEISVNGHEHFNVVGDRIPCICASGIATAIRLEFGVKEN